MKPGKRLFGALILVDGAAFLVLLGLSAWQRSANVIIPSYALKWEIAQALLGLIKWLPALQFLGIALALGSLAGKSRDLLSTSILPAVVLSTLLSAMALIASPNLETSRHGYLDQSRRFNLALSETKSALVDGRIEEARASYGVLKAVDRLDPRAVDLEAKLNAAEAKAGRQAAPAAAMVSAAPDPAAAKAHLAQAQEYFHQKDFYSANWHARKAFELDSRMGEAKILAERAWGEIIATGGSEAEAGRAAFFARKMEAFGRLRSGDAVGAYRLFSEMAKEDPDDADVRRYLTESLGEIGRIAFFRDESDEAAAARVFPRFFIVLPEEGGGTSALLAREAAFAPVAAYFYDLEYIATDATGHESLHLMTPYAKLMTDRLLFESVEKDRPSTVYAPALVSGGMPPLEKAIKLDVLTAYRLAVGLRLPASASTLDLFAGALAAPRFGMSADPFLLELLRRLGMPFGLFGASVLGALVGIRFRPQGGKPKKAGWLALPVMALTVGYAWLALDASDAVLSAWVLRIVDGPLALAVSAGLRAVVLAILVIIAAGLRQHVPNQIQD